LSRANEALTYEQHQDAESNVRVYLRVFLALLVLTVAEYFYAMLVQQHFLLLVTGLVAMAAVKATLVGLFFMHVKFEGRWIYLVLVPAAFLVVALLVGIYPDIGRAYSKAEGATTVAAPARL
jgi:cytochrome c oxidase subunit 4